MRAALTTAALAFLGREPTRMTDFEALGRRLGWLARNKPYGGHYIRNLLRGVQPMMPWVADAAVALTEVSNRHVAEHGYRTVVQVAVRDETFVPAGTLVLADAVLCPCGLHFIPRSHNQRYHNPLCKVLFGRRKAG